MNNHAKVMVVDDDPMLLSVISELLEADGYPAIRANNGKKALTLLESNSVDLIIADIAMPEMNGYQLLDHVKQNPEWAAIPFIFLTARGLDSDVRYGKELGVDDYLVKPIKSEDLLATVRGKLLRARQYEPARVARHSNQRGPTGQTYTVGSLKIDPLQHRVWFNGDQIQLSAREFKLLEHLAKAAGNVHSPQSLVETTHDLETDRTEAGTLIRPLIRSLRRKLGYPPGDMGCIENVRGVGYRLLNS